MCHMQAGPARSQGSNTQLPLRSSKSETEVQLRVVVKRGQSRHDVSNNNFPQANTTLFCVRLERLIKASSFPYTLLIHRYLLLLIIFVFLSTMAPIALGMPQLLLAVGFSIVGINYFPQYAVSNSYIWSIATCFVLLASASLLWNVYIYPKAFSPLRHLPQPGV